MCELNTNVIEFRKDVWRAARESTTAINLTDQVVRVDSQGLIVYEDERDAYCDGRAPAVFIMQVPATGRVVVFLPLVEEESDVRRDPAQTAAPLAAAPIRIAKSS